MTKTLAIASQTVGGYFRDRLFHAVSIFALLLLLFATMLSTLTIVEQNKILLDFGLAAASLVGVGFAILLGSSVIRREIDNRTIYTVLAKPVGRAQYVFGKFLGAAFVLVVIHLVSALVLAGAARAFSEVGSPGLWAAVYLMALESLVLLAVAIFFSLFFSSGFLSVTVTIAVFLLGRSNYAFQLLSEKAESPALRAVLRAAYQTVPSLQRFDIRDLVAYGKAYPEQLVPTSTAYFLAYLILVLSGALLLFRNKDLN